VLADKVDSEGNGCCCALKGGYQERVELRDNLQSGGSKEKAGTGGVFLAET
jgi:hypothetical protein